jgi:hypothetical protein
MANICASELFYIYIYMQVFQIICIFEVGNPWWSKLAGEREVLLCGGASSDLMM